MNIAQFLTRADHRAETYRPLSNNERRAAWSAKYYAAGHHLKQKKSRIRVTVPKAKD